MDPLRLSIQRLDHEFSFHGMPRAERLNISLLQPTTRLRPLRLSPAEQQILGQGKARQHVSDGCHTKRGHPSCHGNHGRATSTHQHTAPGNGTYHEQFRASHSRVPARSCPLGPELCVSHEKARGEHGGHVEYSTILNARPSWELPNPIAACLPLKIATRM